MLSFGGVAHLVERLNGIQKAEGSNPFNSTKKGLSERCCFKKRYSDSFLFEHFERGLQRNSALENIL